jgi:DNA polymerase I
LLIQSREAFEHARTVLLDADVIAVDTETNWTDSWDLRQLMGISTHCAIPENPNYDISYYFPFRHEHDENLFESRNLPYSWLRDLSPAFERTDCIYVGHGFKFDFKVFEKEGISITGEVRDTLLLSWMEDENKFSHELEELAKTVADKKLRKELKDIAKNLHGWEKIPPEVMELYACGDARITYLLYKYFWQVLENQGIQHLYAGEEKKLRILTKMEQRGIQIDKDTAVRLSQEALAKMQETLDEFGYDPGKPAQLAHRLFSAPPEGLGLEPIGGYSSRKSKEFAPYGIPIMDANVLSRLNHPEALRVLDYRSWQKANSTWYEGWFNKVALDSRIHPEFKQHGTITTRLSCTKPNMHQIPRDIEKTPVKSMLRAKDGFELWEFDYSQIEFRLGVVYAECLPIIKAYKEGFDVHQLTSDRIGIQDLSGLSLQEARYAGKQTNYLTIYGGGPAVLIYQLWRDAKIQLAFYVAEEILEGFNETYPEFQRMRNKAEGVGKSRGYVKLWTGRHCRFQWPSQTKDAFNRLCQGGAAEIVARSMIDLDEEGFEIVNQVHDSLWIEIPKDDSEQSRKRITTIMEWPGDQFDIPFPVDEKQLA